MRSIRRYPGVPSYLFRLPYFDLAYGPEINKKPAEPTNAIDLNGAAAHQFSLARAAMEAEFLVHFPLRRLSWAFAVFNLSARKVPVIVFMLNRQELGAPATQKYTCKRSHLVSRSNGVPKSVSRLFHGGVNVLVPHKPCLPGALRSVALRSLGVVSLGVVSVL
jgi:hypothetical protein